MLNNHQAGLVTFTKRQCHRKYSRFLSLSWYEFQKYQFNSSQAKFLSRNINRYLQYLSFLQTNTTQVVEILPLVRQGPTVPSVSSLYHGCWRPGDARRQGISNHDIDLVKPGYLASVKSTATSSWAGELNLLTLYLSTMVLHQFIRTLRCGNQVEWSNRMLVTAYVGITAGKLWIKCLVI